MQVHAARRIAPRSVPGAAFALPCRAVHRTMGRQNLYADLSALLDATRKLTDEEMAELQLELGYTDRALLIYERLLRAEPKNLFYRRRCEWLARLLMASAPTQRRSAVRTRKRVTTRRGSQVGSQVGSAASAAKAKVEPIAPDAVLPLEIITVGQ